MPKVLVLADHIASQIAAGEVVERPSSVVKELVENALDSGASKIEISVSADCRDIRVADNGCGMASEDAVLAFHRHATSKLRSVEDLWSLNSLGFRGEALPSIASVSKMTCFTRQQECATGHKVESADGKVTAVETGCAQGTVMEVHDLFYNVPARLNFLKRASTEFGHIHECVQSLAIAYPAVSFALINQGQSVFKTTGSGDLALTISESGLLSGRESLCEVRAQDHHLGITIAGYVARPLHFRGDRKGILSIVNARPVRCPLTYKALDYAYSDLIPRGKYPLAVVAVTVDPKHLDVNIHPTKKEIKYSNGNEVYVSIQRALLAALREAKQEALAAASESRAGHVDSVIYSALASSAEAPLAAVAERINARFVHADGEARADSSARHVPDWSTGTLPAHSSPEDQPLAYNSRGYSSQADQRVAPEQLGFRSSLSYSPEETSRSAGRMTAPQCDGTEPAVPRLPAGWRIAGYIHNTYIILETPEGMEIVEQHIAHERTLYERLLAEQDTAGRTTEYAQRLLISTPLDLTPEQRSTVESNEQLLRNLGFEFEVEAGTITCTQVPLELAHKDYAVVVQDLVQQLVTADGADLDLEATKSIACQSAIKNGMPLSESDLIQLLADWNDTERNDTCPHGRPVRLKFSSSDLFQMFHPA